DHFTATQIIDSGVREVTLGDQHTCARLSDNSFWCWGADEAGQIGKGDTVSRQNPVPIVSHVVRGAAGGHHTCVYKDDGSYSCWGRRDHGQLGDGTLGVPQLLPEVINLPTAPALLEIAAGELHTCTHHSDGTLWCEGLGADGEIGDGAHADRATPV